MMDDVTVEAVQSRRDQKAFLNFPRQLYAHDPLWVPSLRHDEVGLVGFRHHPFYDRAESQAFLALRDGEVCGRIVAIHNRAHNEYQGDNRGFFGFFECRNDPRAAAALFDAACGWLAQRGLDGVRGPANPSLNYSIGTLIDGFDRPPTFMLPYNPPYYPELIEGYGFRKTQDLYAYEGHAGMLSAVDERLGSVVERIIEYHGVTFRHLRRRHFARDVAEFLTIFNRSLVGHWGMVPLSSAEVAYLARGLSWLLVPEGAIAAEMDGRVVGVSFALPDYNPRVRRIGGRLFPFGLLHLVAGKRRIKRWRVVATNVLPEYHLLGIGMTLTHTLRMALETTGGEEAEFSWVAESNLRSRGALEKGGAVRTKTYRVYDLG